MTTTNQTQNRPYFTKLPSGDWGVRLFAPAEPGAEVVIGKRDGTTTTVRLARIVTQASDTWTWEIARSAKPARRASLVPPTPPKAVAPRSITRAIKRGVCRSCRGPIVDAPHCRAHSGWCGSCAYDEE